MLAGLLFKRLEKQTAAVVAFNRQRCLRSRLNTNTCDLCVSLCQKQALAVSGRKIVFSADRCTGCMACVSGCPNDAFSCGFDFSSLPAAINRKAIDEPVVLSCGKSPHQAGEINLPCLGLLSEPVLLALHCAAQKDFFLDVQPCVDCENRQLLAILPGRLQGISNRIGRESGLRIDCLTEEKIKRLTAEPERRYFLNLLKKTVVSLGREAAAATARSLSPEKKNSPGTDEKEEVMFSRLLVEALGLLPNDADQEKELLHSCFYTLKISRDCTLCPLCTGMCPTGALKLKKENDRKQLYFISAKCSGCGLCRDFCKKRALELSRGFDGDPGLGRIISASDW